MLRHRRRVPLLVREIPGQRLPTRFAPVWRGNNTAGTLQRTKNNPYPDKYKDLRLARVLRKSLQHSRLFN
jgi:hypothetical protein